MNPSPTFRTHVDLDDTVRGPLIQMLNERLATTLDLYSQVKQAHWNIKGAQFFARHELFDRIAQKLAEAADNLAERVATLGGYALGTVRCASAHSHLPEYDLSAVEGRAHIAALVHRYAAYASGLRGGVALARELGDPPTEDLLVEILRAVELDLWFLDSHMNS